MKKLQFVDQVYDNIHGYIRLTDTELRLLATPTVQRLRHIKQLGLASLVFPGAEHTRFAHSLGVLHIVEQLTTNLDMDNTERQLIRIGALLHDIGHFPLSHSTEDILAEIHKNEVSMKRKEWADDLLGGAESENPVWDMEQKLHEFLGQYLIQNGDIASLLEAADISPLHVAEIAMGTPAELGEAQPTQGAPLSLTVLSQMLHSQIDADRIDYLLRDSAFSGLESGGFDLPKLYKEVRWKDNIFGFNIAGLRAVEQFLMTRLTNYHKVVFNKHVQAFEWMCKRVYRHLVLQGALPDFTEIVDSILSRGNMAAWLRLNDHFVMNKIAQLAQSTSGGIEIDLARRIINASAPKQVRVEELFGTAEEWALHCHSASRICDNDLATLAKRFGLSDNELVVVENAVKILDRSKEPIYIWHNDGFTNILDMPESLVRHLSDKTLYIRRLYCLRDDKAEELHHHLNAP